MTERQPVHRGRSVLRRARPSSRQVSQRNAFSQDVLEKHGFAPDRVTEDSGRQHGRRHVDVEFEIDVELIDRLSAGGEFVLSAQCLNELSSVVLRRGMPIADVRAAVSTWSGLAEVLPLTQAATSAGLAAVERHGLSFWDATCHRCRHSAAIASSTAIRRSRDDDGQLVESEVLQG